MMSIIMNPWLWIGMGIFFLVLASGIGILIYLIFKRTHLKTELKAFMTKTPIGIFFQDNKFAEWKPITPINGVVYDQKYGPFIVSNTYVDKKTKNIIIPFDTDLDGDRTCNIKELINEYTNITNNEKSIVQLRTAISGDEIEETDNLKNLTSEMKFSSLKTLFNSIAPHNIKQKIEKIIAERVKKHGNVNPIQALIVFAGIFGTIVMAGILLNIMGLV